MSNKPYGAFETAKFSYNFISDNFSYFIHVLKPLLPVLLLNAWLAGAMEKGEHADNPTFLAVLVVTTAIVSFIYTTAFVITWHRAVILGPSDDHKVNPLRMTKSEWGFLFAGLLIILGLTAIGLVGGIVFGVISTVFMPLAVIGGIVLFIVMIIYASRLYLYFPAKAAGADITFREALKIGKGVTGKLLGSIFVSTIPLIAMVIVIMPVAVLVITLIVGLPETLTERLIFSALLSPFRVFIEVLGAAAMVGVLSRYYMWTVQQRIS